jgi:light-regulated signal transduction histidine kinase (bacteriophytochrome)
VQHVVEDLAPECSGREIEWRIGGLFSAECDPGLMKQVFVNLLSNAVKYSGKRERAVIEVGQTVQNKQRVIFVRDNGVGFEMQYAGKLFGVFQRLHKARDFEGTGVGLAIVQRIIRKHGGRIWAEAELDQGATFFFTLESPHNNTSKQPELPMENGVTHAARS